MRTEFTHIISKDTPYYKISPQQGHPPEGTLNKGTLVELISNNGTYSKIRFHNQNIGHVSSDSIQPIT